MKILIRLFCLSFLSLVLVTGTAGGAIQDRTIDQTFAVDGTSPVDLEFSDNDGDIHIMTWDRNEVQVLVHKEIRSANGSRAERLLEDTKVDIFHRKNTVRIKIRYPRIRGFIFIANSGRVKVTSEVRVPVNTNVDCRVDDGDISIEGIEGRLFLRADDGTIRLTGAKGEVDASADDGRIYLEEFVGKAFLDSDDGDILLSGVFTALDCDADDGDIRVKNFDNAAIEGDWKIETDDGDVDLFFAPDLSANLFIRTDDGRIDSQLPISLNEIESRHNLSGIVGKGGPRISIKTDDGDITLRESL